VTGPTVQGSGRVTLSAPGPADAEEFVDAAVRSAGLHHPWLAAPDTLERFEQFLGRVAPDDQECFLLRGSDSGALIGYVNLSNIVRGAFFSAYLGYAAFVDHAGRGLMTEGLRRVIDEEAFGRLNLHRLEANIQPDNVRSIELVRGLGLRREGYSPRYLFIDGSWKDHERWAITIEEWIERKER
jgi:ribosomal-protein-alanine N-acetyltransferase